MRSIFAALALRAVYLGTGVFRAVQGDVGGSLLVFGVLLATSPLLYLGKKEARFWHADAAITALFLVAMLQRLWILEPTLMGPDKIFHFVGGAIIGYFLTIALSPWVPGASARGIFAVAIAIAVGAGWEVFEWGLFSHTGELTALSYPDSMLDLIADGMGAAVGAAIGTKS